MVVTKLPACWCCWSEEACIKNDSIVRVQTAKSVWRAQDHASWYILIIKANKMHCFSNLFR